MSSEIIQLKLALPIIALVAFILAWSVNFSNITGLEKRDQPLLHQNLHLLKKQVASNPEDPQGYVELGWAAYLAGDLTQAETAFNQALQLQPDYIPALVNQGILRLEEGKKEEARLLFQKVIKINEKHELALFNLGVINLGENNFEEAEKYFNQVLRLNPTSGDSHYFLAIALEKQGEIEQAKQHLNQTLHFLPEHAGAKEALIRFARLKKE